MVGQVRLVLQRFLSRFLFLDLALFRRRCQIAFTGDFGQRLTTLVIRTTKRGSVTRAHLVIITLTPLIGQELHRSTKLCYRFVTLIKTTLQRLDLLLQGLITTLEISDFLTSTSQTTPDSIQLGGSLFETGVDMFIELKDQLIQIGDIQGLFNLQITKLIFED